MEVVRVHVDSVEMSDRISVAENSRQPFQSRIAFVVPTMNRPAELRRLLASVESQSALPDEIIIVDGSSEPVDWPHQAAECRHGDAQPPYHSGCLS